MLADSTARPLSKPLPLALILWGAIGIALNVGLARFTYGVMLPAIRRDLGLGYFGSGSLNAVHLAGYLAGTLAAPVLLRRAGPRKVSRYSHLLVAAGALLCAVAPASPGLGSWVLGVGRIATGLGAGSGVVAILVVVFGAVATSKRPLVSAIVWSGMGASIIASGCAISFLLDSADGWRIAFAMSALLALAVAFGFGPAPAVTPPSSSSAAVQVSPALESNSALGAPAGFALRQIVSPRWRYLVASYLLFGVAYVAYATFTGAQLSAMGASSLVIGATWGVMGLMSMLGAALTVPAVGSDKLKGLALIATAACGTLGAGIASHNTGEAVLIGALLVGLGLAATPTIVSALIRERCHGDEYAQAFSLATAALGIGQLIGPLAGGALGDRFGAVAIPVFAAGAYGLAGLLAVCDARAASRLSGR